MDVDVTAWSGEGAFTQVLIDALKRLEGIALLKVEDAPASRSDASFSFISNEMFVAFGRKDRHASLAALQAYFEEIDGIGPPDYADEGMLQYLRTERIVAPYQTRGYKLIELVRVYEAGQGPRDR